MNLHIQSWSSTYIKKAPPYNPQNLKVNYVSVIELVPWWNFTVCGTSIHVKTMLEVYGRSDLQNTRFMFFFSILPRVLLIAQMLKNWNLYVLRSRSNFSGRDKIYS